MFDRQERGSMSRRIAGCVFAAFLLLMGGCRSAPVYDVVAAPVTNTNPLSMSNMESAIIGAGTGLGWRMAPQTPGQIEGVLALRDHRAVVTVTYDTKSYSIKYKDSSNLNYDGKSIRKNYNGWVENLDRAIRNNLAAL
jgi:hypothetical protein